MVILSLSLYYGDVQSPPCHEILASTSTAADDLNFSIYPNPATDRLNLQFPDQIGIADYNYEIYTSIGSLVSAGQITNNGSIDVSNLVTGMYYLRMRDSVTGDVGVLSWVKQ